MSQHTPRTLHFNNGPEKEGRENAPTSSNISARRVGNGSYQAFFGSRVRSNVRPHHHPLLTSRVASIYPEAQFRACSDAAPVGLALRSMTGPASCSLHSHSHWQAFRGLCRKNVLTQRKQWPSLLLNILLPVLLLVSACSAANLYIGRCSSSPHQMLSQSFARALALLLLACFLTKISSMLLLYYYLLTQAVMGLLKKQALSTATQPNILCYDDNMFMKCSCKYEHQQGAAITNDTISRYYIAGLEHPIESLFSTSHSAKALIGVCEGIITAASAAQSIRQVCEYAQAAADLCPRVKDLKPELVDRAQKVCPNFQSSTSIRSLTQATAIINKGILIADTAGHAGVSISQTSINTVCRLRKVAIIPLRSDLSSSSCEQLSTAECVALAFYTRLSRQIGANHISNFTDESALDAYIKQSGYSTDPAISLLGFAIGTLSHTAVLRQTVDNHLCILMHNLITVFNSGPPAWSYTIRHNETAQYLDGTDGYTHLEAPDTTLTIDTSRTAANDTTKRVDDDIYPFAQSYYTSGILTVQKEIDAFIIQESNIGNATATTELQYRPNLELWYALAFNKLKHTASHLTTLHACTSSYWNNSFANFPTPAVRRDNFWTVAILAFGALSILVIMPSVSSVMLALVTDKELRLKEGMLQMGLHPRVYFLSWVTYLVVYFTVLAALLAGVGAVTIYSHT
eukprot:12320-Heterococcus_DN1.PRE.11